MADEEGGIYVQVAGIGVSIGLNNGEGLSVALFAQGSIGVAGVASIGFTFNPFDWDLLGNSDPNDHVIDFPYGTYVGLGTPPGTPIAAVGAYDPRTGTYLSSLGIGVGDILEVGAYGQGIPNQNQFKIDITPHFPVGTVSSARLPGQMGLIRAGDETNTLDVLSDWNNLSLQNRFPSIRATDELSFRQSTLTDPATGASISREAVLARDGTFLQYTDTKVDPNTGNTIRETYLTNASGDPVALTTVTNSLVYQSGNVASGYELNGLDQFELEATVRRSVSSAGATSIAAPSSSSGSTSYSLGTVVPNSNLSSSGSSSSSSSKKSNSGYTISPSSSNSGSTNSGFSISPSSGASSFNAPTTSSSYSLGTTSSKTSASSSASNQYHTTKTYENIASGKVKMGLPIVIDLDGDGVEISPLGGSFASFDFDGDGFDERTAWVGQDDGILVYDIGNDGQVTEAREFAFALWTSDDTDTDLDALKVTFDSNNDGHLNSQDADWALFKVWNDANQDGKVDAGELSSLADQNIVSLDLARKADTQVSFSDGSTLHGLFDVKKSDGSTVLGGDMAFAYAALGVKATNVNGLETVEFETGERAQFKTLAATETNFSLTGDLIGATGNALANRLDGSAQTHSLIIDGGAGNDTVIGGLANDILSGGSGSDTISAGAGDDIVYADREDHISNLSGGTGYDQLVMAADARLSTSDIDASGFEAVFASDQSDYIRATNDTVDHQFLGNKGNDTLLGAGGDDLLAGGEGADNLTGGYGDDVLIGGTENDYLRGGDGDDTYVFNRGDGRDTILDQAYGAHEAEYNYQARWSTGGKWSRTVSESRTGVRTIVGEYDGGIDLLQFGTGVSINDISLSRSGSSMVIHLRDATAPHLTTGDQITVQDWADTDNRIEYIRFADGSTIDVSQIVNGRYGWSGNDYLYGTSNGDFITSFQGNDTLRGYGGDDYLIGGDGNDQIFGGDDRDTLLGGMGTDVLYGENGNDIIDGGDGIDTLKGGAGDDILLGGAGNDDIAGDTGNDTLVGGTGSDSLKGGAGDDTYVWGSGDGKDTILDQHTVQERYTEAYTVNVQRGWGKWRRWVTETRYRSRVRTVEVDGGDDTLRLGAGLSFENLTFDRSGDSLRIGVRDLTNTARTMDSLDDVVTVQQWTDTNNRIETIAFADGTKIDTSEVVYAQSGYSGHDTIYGTANGDILSGGDGNDRLYASNGDDYLIGGNGNDYLDGGYGDDDLWGGTGDDTLQGNLGDDYLLGGDGNDYLAGGDGNDVLIGGTGNDTLRGGRGDDTYIVSRGAGFDTIDESAFTTEAYQYNVAVQREVETFRTETRYKTVKSGKNTIRQAYTVQVSNGTSKIWVNETRTGYRTKAVEGGDDTLQFAGNISISDLLVNTVGNDLVVQLAPTDASGSIEDQVTVKQWNYSEFRIETFAFENGFGLNTKKINYAKSGTEGNDVLTAVGGRESWLSGRGGHDTLVGSSYSDILVGGQGNDALQGGNGDDVYVFNHGDGHDTLTDTGSVSVSSNDLQLLNGDVFGDKIVFGAGITVEHISLSRVGSDLRIYVRDPDATSWEDTNAIQDSILIKNWTTASYRIEALQFYDGTDLDISQVFYAWTGTASSETKTMTSLGDWADGGLGNDTIHGLAGDDYLFGRDGNDRLYGDDGHDVMIGGNGDDYLAGGSGNDFLSGDAGDDYLVGDAGQDILVGGDGNDTLNGGNDDDVLIGGTGNDTFHASHGQDIYRFGYGDGQDTYIGNSTAGYSDRDIVLIEGQIEKGSIWFKRIDNNLVMQLLGSEDKMTFTGWFTPNALGGAMQSEVAAFVLGNEMLLSQNVNQLISAMASFDPNDGTTAYGVKPKQLPSSVQVAVNAAWKST